MAIVKVRGISWECNPGVDSVQFKHHNIQLYWNRTDTTYSLMATLHGKKFLITNGTVISMQEALVIGSKMILETYAKRFQPVHELTKVKVKKNPYSMEVIDAGWD
jgi:hypothetical protein